MKKDSKMKVVVPFYPLYTPTEKEDYFKICADITDGEIISVNKSGKFRLIRKILGQNVHGHGRGFPFPEASCLFAKKSVYTFHNNYIGQKWYARILRKYLFNRYDKIHVHSEFAKRNYMVQGIKEEKLEILPNPIDYDYFSRPKGGVEFRKRFGIGADELFALTVGTSYHKNPEIMIEACKIAGVKLVVAGFITSCETEQYPGVVPSGDIFAASENVILTGKLSSEEVLAGYDAATVYVNSSDSDGENFGIAVYEAAAAGVPLCVPDYGTFDIFGDCALFHPNHNPELLAENIRKYFSDPELRKRNSELGKKIAKQFDYGIVRGQYEKLYRDMGII
jgi:glycosyltransferase involved in cell wall biosynthesis